jgi:hypothetical protein
MNDSRLVPLEMSDSEYTQMLQALAKDAAGQLLR